MKESYTTMFAASVFFAAVISGCASGPVVNSEASTSAIRAAEEVGASSVPTAALYLQLAKEELENARGMAAKGDKDQAARERISSFWVRVMPTKQSLQRQLRVSKNSVKTTNYLKKGNST